MARPRFGLGDTTISEIGSNLGLMSVTDTAPAVLLHGSGTRAQPLLGGVSKITPYKRWTRRRTTSRRASSIC